MQRGELKRIFRFEILHIPRSKSSLVSEDPPLLIELFEARGRRKIALAFSEYKESSRDEGVVEEG